MMSDAWFLPEKDFRIEELILLKQKVLFLTVRESFRCFFELQMGFHVFCTEERPVSNNSAIKPKSVAVLQ